MTSAVAGAELRYLHRELAASDDTPTQYTASSGTTTSAIAPALIEADDYWNGALVRWDTGSNAGLWSNVSDFVASSDRLRFDEKLPNTVEFGDLFTLFLGGKHASSVRIPGLAAGPLANVAGFDVTYVASLNGEGTGVLKYSSGALTWQPPGEDAGSMVGVTTLADGQSVVLIGGGTTSDQLSKYVILTRNSDSLPAGDATDDVSLDRIPGFMIARVTGEEAAAGITIYRPAAVRSAGGAQLEDACAYCAKPFPKTASTTLSTAIGTGSATLAAGDLAGWQVHGWVYNSTKDDVRYYFNRSGNGATILNPSGGHRSYTAADWDSGDTLVPFPWIDIGLDAPGASDVFEDPATRETAPSGVVFSCPLTAGDGLSIGDLAIGEVHVVWIRLEIPAGAMPIEGGLADVRIHFEVPN